MIPKKKQPTGKKKNHICFMLPQIPIEKCVSTEKLSDLLVGHKFCKILIFLFSFLFIKATSTVNYHLSVDFLEGTGQCSFSRKCLLNIQVLIIVVSVLFLSSNKWYPIKKEQKKYVVFWIAPFPKAYPAQCDNFAFILCWLI